LWVSDEQRFVQLIPPGSGCSIVVCTGIVDMQPGSLRGLQLVVADSTAVIGGRGCLALHRRQEAQA
jgi:hypothetical protein